MTVSPFARRPASSRQDLSCALATGISYSMPRSSPPWNTIGASPPARAVISAPILSSGSITRPIGLDRSDSSPVMMLRKGRPARRPDIRRVVVPLLPASRISSGSVSPCIPTPEIWTVSPRPAGPGVRSISTPIARSIPIVEVQSAPPEKLVTVAEPSATALNMTARWEMDLSPGISMEPRRRCGRETSRAMVPD